MDALTEGAELTAESGTTYLAISPLGQQNVWTAVDKNDHSNIVVLKAPSADDTGKSWPLFQHEMIMHELFKESTSIRKQVDRIPPVNGDGSPPVLVLEIFQATLWHARTKRPFSKAEIKAIARAILQGLLEVHAKGLVYVDLKMQNVMLDGFDSDTAGDGVPLISKLGDLGIVMEPSNGKAQPVAYRAPEVYFRGVISQAADIWAFGLIYCHLLEAQGRFSRTGLYDDLYIGTGSMSEREQAMRNALANDYDLKNVGYYKDCALPIRDPLHNTGNHWEVLRQRGLDEEDVKFLQWILKADPRERPTPQAILDSHWLQVDASNAQQHGVDQTAFTPNMSSQAEASSTAEVTSLEATGTSEAADTEVSALEPTFDPRGSAAFDSLLRTKADSQNSMKDHPLVADALSKAAQDDDIGTQDTTATGVFADHATATRADDVTTEIDAPTATKERQGIEQSTEETPPALVGRNSSTSGTYLSYR